METRGEGDYGYEPGRKLYPRYSYEGLPEDFVVKKSPDVSFKDRDIEYVEIKKDPFSPAHMSSYIVTIYLQGKSAERMRAFSEKHLKKRVAIEIDGKIINIPTINDIVENKFSIIFVKTSISDLENEIKKVTDKIRIE
jgi:preprotein translocase subunit SecD